MPPPLSPREIFQQASLALQQGRLADAGVILQNAPRDLNFDFLRGTAALIARNFEGAAAIFTALLHQKPDWLEARYNLIKADIGRGQIEAALAAIDPLLKNTPSPIPALLWAEAAEARGDQAAMNEAFALAIERGARDASTISNLWLGRRKLWDWREPLPPFAPTDLTPAAATVLSDDPAFQKEVAVNAMAGYPALPRPVVPPAADGRLRIGYLSSDIHHHATAYLMAELFALHDRRRFAVTLFSASPDDGSTIRKRITDSVETFVDISSDPLIAIIAHPVDIMIDLKGHTRGNLLPLLARRLAPLQIHYLGHPGTIGARFIDYLVGDPVVTPVEDETFYSEKIIRLPHCYQVNDSQRPIAPALPRAAYGLPENKIVLACFNQTYKLTPEVFAQWTAILHARPGTILWLYCNVAGAESNLRAHMATLGLSDERLVIAAPLPNDQHLARYQAADIVLDTYPYTSHTTGSDALWAGVPLITRRGKTYASRVAASLLMNVDLPELITENADAYQQLILDLIDDAPRRTVLREHLIQARTTAPLFNTAQWVHDWEAALQKLI